jgi:hypothetical protein
MFLEKCERTLPRFLFQFRQKCGEILSVYVFFLRILEEADEPLTPATQSAGSSRSCH